MFRFNQKSKKKHYELRSNDHHILIPLTFNGKSAELNSQALGRGQYTLHTEEQKIRDHIWVMVM